LHGKEKYESSPEGWWGIGILSPDLFPMLLDEGNELVRGPGMDLIGVLGRQIVDGSGQRDCLRGSAGRPSPGGQHSETRRRITETQLDFFIEVPLFRLNGRCLVRRRDKLHSIVS
jgi:hypothetical protein